ncbi:mandelate racemase/muconate lactonizing enzyme family protein [Halorarum salinum]|uniref:Mandelate racemase/muconate lactonizing enzyme family protein n=1 Tax=Halorarum salinum TaxID=2743089 RepID=A0A7D5LA57_9EURY|nr:mandelate racemase/muconate lactonizing enzyme family protein [Halobaculum salinum]QLG61752.1 mandelate racemase/muconate lactonizing enzyme family protein [Halobaculum salinum]
MRITDVRGFALSSPIDPPQDRRFHGGTRRLLKRDVVLAVVDTADGQRGAATAGATSSSMREFFEDDSHGTFADVLENEVADALEGEEVDAMADAHGYIDATDLPARLKTKAVSAVDVALHDIRGKELGAPVYELLLDGYEDPPAPTKDLPLYASSGMYMEPEGYAEQAGYVEEAGFFGYKYRPGIGPERDRRTIDLVTEAVTETEVMLDAHTWWKLEDAYGADEVAEIVAYADERGAYWVEEPVAPDDYDGYRRLAETGAALAGGESEAGPEGLLALGETGAVDFLQGDVRHHRGFTGCRRAVELCRGRPVEFVPHNFGTWLGLLANAHLVAAAPEVELVEYPIFENDPLVDASGDPGMYPFDLAFDLVEGRPPVSDGRLAVPDAPGLGIEVDLDVVDEYPFTEGAWTEFRYDE